MSRILNAVAVPWPAFVAAFLYYTLLTLVVIGMADLPAIFLVSYGLPVALYVIVLGARAVRALSSVRIDLGPLPYPSLR